MKNLKPNRMPVETIWECYPPLTPKLPSWMKSVTDDPSLLKDIFEQYGSPVNLHHPKPFAENYKAFKAVLDWHQLKHTVFFARKANPSLMFPKAAKRLGFGVDTASYRELKQCLELDFDRSRLVLTAAIKTEQLIRLALNHDVLIMIDNEDECRLINNVAEKLGKTPCIGIRISGFCVDGEKLYSRFGFDIDDAADFITHRLGEDKEFYNLHFSGFHFHLDGYSIKQRAEALLQTLEQTDSLQEQGITTHFIDTGGGILNNYLTDKKEWETFWRELKKAVRGERNPITFGNSGLGYEMIHGELAGSPKVYPYYNETPKEQFLEKVLSYKNKNKQSVASLLRERDIEFRMEPGRSLLDQTGMTLAKVAHRKRDRDGNWLVGLEMNGSQLRSSSADFLVDPIFIPMNDTRKKKNPTPVFFTGGYCLEGDIILKRKIVLPQLPEVGDIMAFPNTAGYMMHFYETQSHLFELSTNLVAEEGEQLHFIPDEEGKRNSI